MVSNEETSLRKAIQNSFYIMPDNAPVFIQQLVDLMHLQDRAHYRYMIEQCISGMLDETVYDKLESIKIPVLVLFGERDNLIPNRFIHPVSTKKLATDVVAKFDNARLKSFPNAGILYNGKKPRRSTASSVTL